MEVAEWGLQVNSEDNSQRQNHQSLLNSLENFLQVMEMSQRSTASQPVTTNSYWFLDDSQHCFWWTYVIVERYQG